MIEYHDPSGDEQDDLLQPDIDPPGERAADAFGAHAPAPLDDLGPTHAPTAPDLLFPGDDVTEQPAPTADLDPSAPWPDDHDFTAWLGSGEELPAADDPAARDVVEQLRAAPEAGGLAPADELVDWTLRRLTDG